MSIKRIAAMVPPRILADLEARLARMGVPGVTVETVRGYGQHPNYFSPDLMQEHVRVLIYAGGDMAGEIVEAIVECVRHCQVRTGILAVESIDRLVDLGSGTDFDPDSGLPPGV